VVTYGMTLLSVFLLALIIDALAPSFDGQKNRVQAFKVAAYTGTAGWVFGVLRSSRRWASSCCWPASTACTCCIWACPS
jgi:hypothetical protein